MTPGQFRVRLCDQGKYTLTSGWKQDLHPTRQVSSGFVPNKIANIFVVAPRSPRPNPLESGLDCGPAHTGLSRRLLLHQRPLRLAAPRRLLRDNLGVNMNYDLIVLISSSRNILPRPSAASMLSIL